MLEWLWRQSGGTMIALLAVGLTFLSGIVAIITGYLQKVKRWELEASLKHDMLNRGISVEEIERVLKASHKSSRGQGGDGKEA